MPNYAYLSGVIKYIEQKLPDANDIERMVDTESAEHAFRVFNDTDYADNLLDVEPVNFQKALEDDMRQAKDLFMKHINMDLLKFMFIRYDIHNIKLFLKAHYSGKNLDEYKFELGIEEPEKIKNFINEIIIKTPLTPPAVNGGGARNGAKKNKTIIDKDIASATDNAVKSLGDRPFPHRIDYILDHEYWRILQKISKKIKNKYIAGLLRFQIDATNLKIFIRAKITEKPYEFVEKKFIENGCLEINDLKKLYNEEFHKSLNFFKDRFKNKGFGKIIDNLSENPDFFWRLEKTIEDMETDYIKKTKLIPYGPEVVLGYYFAKRIANRNVRLIMIGKLNNIENHEIKERLRQLY